MKRIETTLPGVCLIQPAIFSDQRGSFFETYHRTKFNELGISCDFVQDNHATSVQRTLRGLHYQIRRPQAKLCRVVVGEVLDVVVDIRRGSPNFGRHLSTVLSEENRQLIFIPPGFAHGYLVLSTTAEFLYKCSDFYYPDDERGLIWNDPEVGIAWGVEEPIVSIKDQKHPPLAKIPLSDLAAYE